MDSVMNSCRRSRSVCSLVFHSLLAVSCSLLCSYFFWLPSPSSGISQYTSLPNIWYSLFSPKCLFVVANIIIIYIVGESKFGCSDLSSAAEIYDEFDERRQSLGGKLSHMNANMDCMKRGSKVEVDEETIREEIKDLVNVHNERGECEKDYERVGDREEAEDEEEGGLPVEELNRRAEEFIARVNRRIWLEGRL